MSKEAELIEAYHNILYIIEHAKQNNYPKFSKNDVEKISKEDVLNSMREVLSDGI